MNAYLAALRPALRALAVALTMSLAVFGLTAVTAPAHAGSRVMSMSSGTYESKVQYHINKKREARGLPKLRLESCTDGTAERWAQHLAESGSFYHQDMGNIIDRCNAYYAGETLGRGAISPRKLVYRGCTPRHTRTCCSVVTPAGSASAPTSPAASGSPRPTSPGSELAPAPPETGRNPAPTVRTHGHKKAAPRISGGRLSRSSVSRSGRSSCEGTR
jgi:hypothetical protein